MPKNKKRLLLVEDELDIADLLKLHLTREGYEVTALTRGEQALISLEQQSYDLAILDWMLPGISGLDLCKKFSTKLPILMVTAKTESHDIVLGLEMGAEDYITKPFELPVFLARVRAILRRNQTQRNTSEKDFFHVGDLKINTVEHKASCGDENLSLTKSEFKLLVALMRNEGRVLTRDKLVGLVQGGDVSVTDRTIDTHVFGLRKKIGIDQLNADCTNCRYAAGFIDTLLKMPYWRSWMQTIKM